MGVYTGRIDVDKLLSFSDDLVSVLKEEKDVNIVNQCIDQSKALAFSCDAGFNDSRSLLEDHQKKIDECKQKAEKAKLEVSANDELDHLQKELEQEREKEYLLMEELRVINSEINDLERRRILVEEQKQTSKKQEQEELRMQRKLSMYACVTTIIPDLDDRSKISGYIVDRDEKKVERLELDPSNMTAFDTCQSIWKMINV